MLLDPVLLLLVSVLPSLGYSTNTTTETDSLAVATTLPEVTTLPPDVIATTHSSGPATPISKSSLLVSIATPVIAVLGILGSTALVCYTHFKKKREVRRRVMEARKREILACNQDSNHNRTSNGQDASNDASIQNIATSIQNIAGNTTVQDTTGNTTIQDITNNSAGV